MKKVLLFVWLCAFMAMPVQSFAEDIAAISCSDYNATETETDKLMMILWIDGYLGGSSDVTETSEAWFSALYNHMNTYCAANPSIAMLDAAFEVPETEIEGVDALENSCAEIIAEAQNEKEVAALLMWADGYLSAKAENTVLNEAFLASLGAHIMQFCAGNANKTLGDALAGQSK